MWKPAKLNAFAAEGSTDPHPTSQTCRALVSPILSNKPAPLPFHPSHLCIDEGSHEEQQVRLHPGHLLQQIPQRRVQQVLGGGEGSAGCQQGQRWRENTQTGIS